MASRCDAVKAIPAYALALLYQLRVGPFVYHGVAGTQTAGRL